MRVLPQVLSDHLTAGKAVQQHWLLWLRCRNRDTGLVETIGLWDGPEDRVFGIGGTNYTYFGAGALLEVPQITRRKGVADHRHTVTLSGLSPAVRQALETYDPNRAEVVLHRAWFDPLTGRLIAEPLVELTGRVDAPTFRRSGDGEAWRVQLKVASLMQRLTVSLPIKKSHATQPARKPAQAGLPYIEVSGSIPVAWGEISISERGDGGTAGPPPVLPRSFGRWS